MLHVQFSPPTVLAYTAGRNEKPPLRATVLPQVAMKQTHSANVEVITTTESQELADCDALITAQANLLLQVRHADCLPVLIYHQSGVIGAVHAGRRGTELKIVQKVMEILQADFTITDQLEIWFGPAICADCYQINRQTNLHYDLVKENTTQIRSVFSSNQATIQYSDRCTAHQNEHFFSYRKEGQGVPMNWSGIARL